MDDKMKKILIALMALIFILPLAACGNTSEDAAIKENASKWNKTVSELEVVKTDKIGNNRGYIAQTMKQLKKVNKSVIQGTVYDMSKMNNLDNGAYTKVIVYVDKVISGKKSLQGKKIVLVMNGGITTTNRWYKNQNQTREADHDIWVQYNEAPLPKVGSKIIGGITPIGKTEPTVYMKTIKKNNLANTNTYDLDMPAFNFWIKDSKDKQYHLNNPKATKELKVNPEMAKSIKNLTDELNQKYNN